MRHIDKADPEQAERLFEIMVRAVEDGCAFCYPPEVIAIWNKGRSVEGQAGVIAEGHIYSIHEKGVIRGFVDIGDSEVVGLFVHPEDQRKGYGTDLFRFAVEKIGKRPILVLSSLNASPFYSKLGCHKVGTELIRRHGHEIYVEKMELA